MAEEARAKPPINVWPLIILLAAGMIYLFWWTERIHRRVSDLETRVEALTSKLEQGQQPAK